MTFVTVEELDLLGFFGVEPTVTYPDTPWPYNEFVYSLTCGSTSVSFAIEPAYKDLRIILKNGDLKFYELNAVALEDVSYRNDNGRETLEILLKDGDRIWFGLFPTVAINHDFNAKS